MAHILNYQELKNLNVGDIVFEEFKSNPNYRYVPLKYNGIDLTTEGLPWDEAQHYLLIDECDEETCCDYNWNYRVWDDIPSKEDLEKVSWKEDPYKNE